MYILCIFCVYYVISVSIGESSTGGYTVYVGLDSESGELCNNYMYVI